MNFGKHLFIYWSQPALLIYFRNLQVICIKCTELEWCLRLFPPEKFNSPAFLSLSRYQTIRCLIGGILLNSALIHWYYFPLLLTHCQMESYVWGFKIRNQIETCLTDCWRQYWFSLRVFLVNWYKGKIFLRIQKCTKAISFLSFLVNKLDFRRSLGWSYWRQPDLFSNIFFPVKSTVIKRHYGS